MKNEMQISGNHSEEASSVLVPVLRISVHLTLLHFGWDFVGSAVNASEA